MDIKHFYLETTDIWKELCELHHKLFEVTCDEYSYLLANDIESIENQLLKKEEIIKQVGDLEKRRRNVIKKINTFLGTNQINSIKDLIAFLEPDTTVLDQRYLFKFNQILIDIIEKIQLQNKKNQIYLNKALLSLREIREGISGVKNYQTYGKNGASRASTFK